MTDFKRIATAVADQPLPAAVVDLEAFDHNVELYRDALSRHRATLRVATKSIRCPSLIRRALDRGGRSFAGLMTFSAAETELLAGKGFDDLLLGYPIATRLEADRIAGLAARGVGVRVVVDHLEHLRLLGAAAVAAGASITVCIDVDMSTRLPGVGHVGVRRSPLQTPSDVLALAEAVARTPGLHLDALLGYEAQVAGLADHNPRNAPWLDPVRRRIKQHAVPLIARRRRDVLAALAAAEHTIRVFNGGGSGSLTSTLADPSVSEITVGSAFIDPLLFDHYEGLALRPALFFALRVVRVPAPRMVTCAGGGYVASGPPGADRLPEPVYPPGLQPLPMESFGEVQTPFAVARDAAEPHVGDVVLCRPAKAGELAERFAHYTLVDHDGTPHTSPTYRGLGSSFT